MPTIPNVDSCFDIVIWFKALEFIDSFLSIMHDVISCIITDEANETNDATSPILDKKSLPPPLDVLLCRGISIIIW
jgi:hypothetical protein